MGLLLDNVAFQAYGFAASTLLLALAVGWFVWQLVGVITFPREQVGSTHPFERQRRIPIRAASSTYRWFEPLVEELSQWITRRELPAMQTLTRNLETAREPIPWRAEELVATKCVEAAWIGGTTFLLLWMFGWTTLAIVGVLLLFFCSVVLAPRNVGQRAQRRLARLRLRLPFAVDLVALMMEAGGGFQECLQTAIEENGDHPLTEELAEVVRQIALGRPRSEALEAMQARLRDNDVSELVFAINKGEELGTPLTSILRDQAEQMRIKRAQRGEKAAAEAQVSIIFPGMVVMIACLLVIVAPIVLPAILALW